MRVKVMYAVSIRTVARLYQNFVALNLYIKIQPKDDPVSH